MKPILMFAILVTVNCSAFAYDGNSDTWLNNAFKNESTSPSSEQESSNDGNSFGDNAMSWFKSFGSKKNAPFDPHGIIAKPKTWMNKRECLPYYKNFFKKMKSRRMQKKMKKCPNRPDNVAKDIYILVDKAGMDQRPTRGQRRQGGPKQRMFVKVTFADGRPDRLWGPLKISTGASHFGHFSLKKDKRYRAIMKKDDKTAKDINELNRLKAKHSSTTPEGTFDLNTIPRHSISSTRAWCVQNAEDGAAMPNATQIAGGIFFHSGYPGGITGYPASHGCVRMTYNQSEELHCLLKQKNKAGVSNDQRTTVEIFKDASHLKKSDLYGQIDPPDQVKTPSMPVFSVDDDSDDDDSDDDD